MGFVFLAKGRKSRDVHVHRRLWERDEHHSVTATMKNTGYAHKSLQWTYKLRKSEKKSG